VAARPQQHVNTIGSPRLILPATYIAGQRRRASVVANATVENGTGRPAGPVVYAPSLPSLVNQDDIGPIELYDRRVAEGRLKNDEHQRG